MARKNKSHASGSPAASSGGGHAWLFAAAAVLAVLGLADAIYLTVEHLIGAGVECGGSAGCNEVLGSRFARVGKLPLAGFGVLGYFAAFSAATLSAFGYRNARPVLAGVVALMFAATLCLLYLQAYVIHAFCRYCLVSAGLTMALAAIVVLTGAWSRRL